MRRSISDMSVSGSDAAVARDWPDPSDVADGGVADTLSALPPTLVATVAGVVSPTLPLGDADDEDDGADGAGPGLASSNDVETATEGAKLTLAAMSFATAAADADADAETDGPGAALARFSLSVNVPELWVGAGPL